MDRGAPPPTLAVARVLATVAGLAALARPASADPNDLVLSRLASPIVEDGEVVSTVGQSRELRALASQLGVVLAPRLLSPADTLGFGGFQFDVNVSQTAIDSGQSYWRARAGSPDPGGAGSVAHGPSVLRTIGVFARKGMWFPLPSFELGGGAVHLLESRTWTAQAYAKFAVHEGYHDYPLPSIAIRAAVAQQMTQRDLGLTIGSLDATLSKRFTIADTWRFDPFAGYDLLRIVARTKLIDATPGVDPLNPGDEMDAANNFSFVDQAAIYRHRIFGGTKLQYDLVQLTIEASYALAGSSVDDRDNASVPCPIAAQTSACDAADTAAAQLTISMSAGIAF